MSNRSNNSTESSDIPQTTQEDLRKYDYGEHFSLGLLLAYLPTGLEKWHEIRAEWRKKPSGYRGRPRKSARSGQEIQRIVDVLSGKRAMRVNLTESVGILVGIWSNS